MSPLRARRGVPPPRDERQGAPGGLLETAAARQWFELLDWGAREDVYTYQEPLDGRAGPRVHVRGRPMLQMSIYDYLGLTGHPRIEAAAIEAIRRHGTGTAGVRLPTGTTRLHVALEDELAAFKGTAAAITFSSGYAANLAAISSLVGPADHVILDQFSHRSLVEACRLTRPVVGFFRHNSPEALEARLATCPEGGRRLVVVEGLYSMLGDICPLPEILAVARRHGAFLMVDEAHALGVLGRTGRGGDEHWGLDPSDVDVWTGSLSKAVPSNGGFVAGSRALIVYLQHAANPYIFSAALSPPAVGAARAALDVIRREPERIRRMRHNADTLRNGLQRAGFDTLNSESAIVPVFLGHEEHAWRVARRLQAERILVSAIAYPAVERQGARLRLCATAAQTGADLAEFLAALQRVVPSSAKPVAAPVFGPAET